MTIEGGKGIWKADLREALVLLFTAVGFLLLDLQSFPIGDDLGYMFSDSHLHAGDGTKIQSIGDIIATQNWHYVTTNGRWIIHATTQAMVALVPHWVYCALNALMFGLLWLLFSKLISNNTSWGRLTATLLLLWLCIPLPGITMLSLAAFAVNYMWSGVAAFAFLLMLHKRPALKRTYVAYLVFALVFGTLQESYNLPLLGALGTLLLLGIRRRDADWRYRMSLTIAFALGTIVLVAAPGNFGRLSGQGGLSPDVLLHKFVSINSALLFSSVCVMVLLLALIAAIDRKMFMRALHENKVLLLAVLYAWILGCLSYTGPRQIFAPCIFSGVVIGRILFRYFRWNLPAWTSPLLAAFIIAMLWGGYELRSVTLQRWQSVEAQVRQGNKFITVEDRDCNWLYKCPLFTRLNHSPFEDAELKLAFDGFTKRGLQRTQGNGTQVTTVIPCSLKTLMQRAADSTVSNDSVSTAPLCDGFRCFRLPKEMKTVRVRNPKGGILRMERLAIGNDLYYVVPADCPIVILKP